MDLTNIEEKINHLFDSNILPRAGKSYLLTTIDKEAATYYEAPKHPDQAYFSFIDTASEGELAKYFSDFWAGLNTPEFSAMGPALSELAFLLSADHSTQSDELSPFVYTMY